MRRELREAEEAERRAVEEDLLGLDEGNLDPEEIPPGSEPEPESGG